MLVPLSPWSAGPRGAAPLEAGACRPASLCCPSRRRPASSSTFFPSRRPGGSGANCRPASPGSSGPGHGGGAGAFLLRRPLLPPTRPGAARRRWPIRGLQPLDFYRSSRPRAPLVVMVHGGGWDNGERGQIPQLNYWLVGRGYAVADISYRLAPAAAWPAQRADVLGGARRHSRAARPGTLGIDRAASSSLAARPAARSPRRRFTGRGIPRCAGWWVFTRRRT